MLSTVFTAVTDLFQTYLTNKQRKAELKQAIHQQQLAQINQGNVSASALDFISIQSRGWKDELLLLVTIVPLVLCFVPGMDEYIKQGFEVLSASVPEWYMVALALVYIDTLGFRRVLRSTFTHYLTTKIR